MKAYVNLHVCTGIPHSDVTIIIQYVHEITVESRITVGSLKSLSNIENGMQYDKIVDGETAYGMRLT